MSKAAKEVVMWAVQQYGAEPLEDSLFVLTPAKKDAERLKREIAGDDIDEGFFPVCRVVRVRVMIKPFRAVARERGRKA
jgi:hypothetical protein